VDSSSPPICAIRSRISVKLAYIGVEMTCTARRQG